MSVESRRKQREPKTETEKALMAQKTKEGLQGLAIGPVTGLLGLPSDIIDLADIANDAIAKYGADTTIAQFSKLIKPQLDAVQEKYGRDAFDKGFTELTGIKSDPTKPAQFLGELVSLGGVAKTGVKGAKLVGETISDTYKGAKKLFEDSTLPPPDNLAAQTAGAGQFKQTDTLLDKTKSDTSISTEIPSLKTEDLANKPTINPSIIGVETELGQKQIASYEKLIKDSKVLGGKPPSPQRLFERTGVYKGSDGKYRYDLDDRDAEFNTSFLEKSLVKNPNMKNPPIMLSNSIVSYRHLQPKLFTLREVLDFDSLYKQYPKTLKVKDKVYSNIGNVKVKFISGKSGTRGSYDGDTDTITLNITDSSGQQITDLGKIESTLLHEVQHAIQRREGFLRGGNNETMLDKINPNHSKELKEANDELSNKLTLLKDNLSTGFDNIQPFKHTDGSTYNSTEAINYAAGQISKIAYAKALKDKDAVKILEENISSFLENSNFPKGIQQKITKNADNIFFDIQVKRSKLDKETRQSFEEYENLYGEKEARLVQKRYEKRKKFKAMSGGLDFGEDKITNIMRKDTSFIDDMTKKMNKGGDMKKQMDLFQEGGLKDEGGTVDPVSGNDVPPGSTQEEVRDDIPAQLSEGEFVFPADVVRFIGLEKLMTLRQEAKAGLKRMEEMGQMGNSEEATLPDDMPFTIDDLDMEDEEEYNTDTQEMNQGGMVRVGGVEMQKPRIAGQQFADGGVVQAQSGTFVAPGSGVTTMPSQFAGQNLPSYKPNETIQSGTRPAYTVPIIPSNVSNFRQLPIAQTGQQQIAKTPSFEDLLGKNPGQYDELREYVNDAGMKLRIPFKNGQPIYPIPEGYKFVDPEEEQTETTTVQSVKPKTVQTTGEGSDDGGTRVGTTLIGKTGKGISERINTDFANQTPDKVRENFGKLSSGQKGLTVTNALQQAKGYTGLAKGFQQLGTALTPGVLGMQMYGQKTLNPMDVLGKVGAPNSAVLNSLLNAYGPNMTGLTPEEIDMTGIDRNEALSQALYGMSLADATRSMGGVTPSFTPGYKNGDIDPRTGHTYVHGQAGGSFEAPSYTSIAEFGKAMAASSKTGFMGSYQTALDIMNDTSRPEKARNKARAFAKEINPQLEMDEDTRSDQEVEDDLDTISQEVGKTAQAQAEKGFTDIGAFGPQSTTDTTSPDTDSGQSGDGGDGPGGTSSGAGGVEGSVGDSYGGGDYKGAFVGTQYKTNKGLAGKKKPKPKKMKRGGLASR